MSRNTVSRNMVSRNTDARLKECRGFEAGGIGRCGWVVDRVRFAESHDSEFMAEAGFAELLLVQLRIT